MVTRRQLKRIKKRLEPNKAKGIIPSNMTFEEREQRRKELRKIPRIKEFYKGNKSKILEFNKNRREKNEI